MKKHIATIIIFILWGVSFLSIISIYSNGCTLGLNNYVAFGLLALITIVRIIKIKHLKIWIGILLILGTSNLISFTCRNYSLSFGITLLGLDLNTIGVQPLSLVLLLVLVIADIEGARSVYRKIIPATESKELDDTSHVNIYIEKYKTFSITELENIVSKSGSYQKAAIEAAEKLLKQKKKE